MYFCCALAGNIARRTAMGALFRNSGRCQLVSACSAKSEQQNRLIRSMSTQPPLKEQQWSKEDLKSEPIEETNPLEAENWTQVYKFGYINQLRLFIRLKYYHAGIFLITTPLVFILPETGVELSQEMIMFFLGFNVYILASLTIVGSLGQKAVGILYINDRRDKIRAARLTFRGNRVDTMYDLEDVMQTADQGTTLRLPAITLRRYSDPQSIDVVFYKHGIVNKELFEEIFGKPPEPPQVIDMYGKAKKKKEGG